MRHTTWTEHFTANFSQNVTETIVAASDQEADHCKSVSWQRMRRWHSLVASSRVTGAS